MKITAITLATCCVSIACPASAADIGGISIGAISSELRSSIVKMNPLFAVRDIKQSDGKVVGVQALYKQGAGWSEITPDHFVAMHDDRGYTWFLGRAQKYEKGLRPTHETTISALYEKYGAASYSDSGRVEWQFARSGVLYKGESRLGPCFAGLDNISLLSSTVGSPPIGVPKRFAEKCGIHIVAMIRREPDGMISTLVVSAYDSARMFDAAQDKKDQMERKTKNELDAERSINVKPKL